MDKKTYWDKYYYGTGGESFVISALQRNKYDALKLPVDFGFDIIAIDTQSLRGRADVNTDTNDKPRLSGILPTVFLQVKSAKANVESSGSQKQINASFPVTIQNIKLLKEVDNSALVLCPYATLDDGEISIQNINAPISTIWLSSKQICTGSKSIFRPYDKDRDSYIRISESKQPGTRMLDLKITINPESPNTIEIGHDNNFAINTNSIPDNCNLSDVFDISSEASLHSYAIPRVK